MQISAEKNTTKAVTGKSVQRQTNQLGIQRKTNSSSSLTIGAPNDRYEREADAMADRIMRMPQTFSNQPLSNGTNGIQRACAACEEEDKIRRKPLMTKSRGGTPVATPALSQQLSSSKGGGSPLPSATNSFMSQAFGADFSDVRVHTNSRAMQMNQGINARAFAHGSDIYFNRGEYNPNSSQGKRLLGHELTHVVQQGQANRKMINRVAGDPVDRTMALGLTPATGIQFHPTNVTSTAVGPVSIQGGLMNARANRLNIIIGQNLTPRLMARLLLSLWTNATPFTAPGAAAPVPLDIIDEDILAKGLMVYNRYYLGLPNMTKWQAGLRFPLPILIDNATGVATLHPSIIRRMSNGFDPAWLPLLDTAATAVATIAPATLTTDVTAFLTRVSGAMGRGMHLAARAKTNAISTLPFLREAFRQLGAGGFAVALEFMGSMVNIGVSLLAAQRDGAAILAEIRTALGLAPSVLTTEQQASLTRANLMLGLVSGVAAQAPPTARRTQPEKTVVVDTLKLVGSTQNPAAQIAVANAIFSQCNVRITHGVNQDDSTVVAPFTNTWLGGNTELQSSTSCASVTREERSMYTGGTAQYAMGSGRFSAYFVATARGISASGFSCPGRSGVHALNRGKAVVLNSGDDDTLAHELGHHLINNDRLDRHSLPGVMHSRPRTTVTFNDAQCRRIYSNA